MPPGVLQGLPAPAAAGGGVPAPDGRAQSLLPAAMPLLELLGRLRTMAAQPDAAALRAGSEAALQAFAARAAEAGVPPNQVRRSSYALCESLDDAVLNTPWGAAFPAWAQQPLAAALHPDVGPGRFFDVLRQAEAKPDAMRPVLELVVLCLSLGMLGPFRARPGGAAEVEALRQSALAALAAGAPPVPGALSQAWTGADAPFRPRRVRLPLWVAAAAGLAAAGAAFLLFSLRVNADGDAVFARLLAAPPAHMPAIARDPPPAPPPPPPPPDPTARDRVASRLAAQVDGGILAVAGTPTVPVVRLPAGVLFPSGTATLGPQAAPLLQVVADALRPEGGRLHVVGYTDGRPVRTVLFPSAFKLSAAQAEAVRPVLARALAAARPARAGAPARAAPVTAEGRAGADPVAADGTPGAAERNRRVEVVLEGAPE